MDLMRLHVETLFTLDAGGRLVAVNEPGGAAAPRFFLGRTADGNVWWFRHDVDPALVRALDVLCEAEPRGLEHETGLVSAASFIACLARDEPVRSTWAGPAFRFPADLPDNGNAVRVTRDNETVLSPYLEGWRADVAAGVPMVVVLEEGNAVSVCCSVRMTARAHEAGVETHPEFQRQGYAAHAVTAWARAVRELDGIPLYSTSWDNEPSRALAKRLGLIQYGGDLHIT